ncbi:MAG: PEGA domain-containing protein [Spirochaetota bacterium]|nr:MAG: PEGA domain-containing protein [Spirochaetota bacterium]
MCKKIFITILISMFISATGYSYELFINSDPINASVYSGEELLGKTPLRLHDIKEDRIKLTFKKSGFEDAEEEVVLRDIQRPIRFYTLTSSNISIVLNQNDQALYLNEVNAGKTPLIVHNLPGGTYNIDTSEGVISINTSEYFHQQRTAVTETIFSAALVGASILGMIHFSNINEPVNAHALGVTSLVFGGIFGYNILKLSKLSMGSREDKQAMSGVEIRPYTGMDDRNIFASGMELIGREQWEDAVKKFILVINLYEDSQFVPISYYETGYSYYRMGNYPKARQYLRSFVYEYPLYELFPYGIQYLLDVELRLGDAEKAMESYNSVRPVRIDDESGELYQEFYNLYATLYHDSGEKSLYLFEDLKRELDYFLVNYPESPRYPNIYLLKGRLLYQYLDREEALKIFEEIRNNYSYDKELISEMESIVNE